MEPPSKFMQWAIKGEKAIKSGALREGIQYLNNAISEGSDEQRMLSAVYNQLGNAYCQLGEYQMSNQYFYYDLIVTRFLKDKEGEAKVHSNISNVYKLMHDYGEAIRFAEQQLKLGKELHNRNIEMMALSNLGSIYLLKGREAGKNYRSAASALNMSVGCSADGQVCTMKDDVSKALEYFQQRLTIVEEANDRRAAGVTFGNMGSCHYVLREFKEAVHYHQLRLQVAQEYGDKETQRKAYCNLGNAHVFLGDTVRALECYRLALSLAMELDRNRASSKAIQAQICFSLATASTLANDYQQAADYHLRHLALARDLKDTAGESRAHASLSTVFKLMEDYPKALYFLARRRSIAKQLKDPTMSRSAETAFKELLELAGDSVTKDGELILDSTADPQAHLLSPLRLSLSLNSIYESGDCGLSRRDVFASDSELSARNSTRMSHQEDLFDMISRLQSKRMDEQRCEAPILNDISNKPPRQRDTAIPSPNDSIMSTESKRSSILGKVSKKLHIDKPLFTSTPLPKQFSTSTLFSRKKKKPATCASSIVSFDECEPIFRIPNDPRNRRLSLNIISQTKKEGPDTLIDQLMQAQGRRMDEQRANLLPGLRGREDILNKLQETSELEGGIDEQLLDLVARAQGQRMNEQRSELGGRTKEESKEKSASTIPEDDDLTELVTRMARSRIEEQRAHLPDASTT